MAGPASEGGPGAGAGATGRAINLAEKFGLFQETWHPKIIAELNGQYVKLVRLRGEFDWHHHEAEDELFLVIKGRIVVRFRDHDAAVGEGELIVVPAGVEHQPVADEEALVVLIEPKSTLNTGNVRSAFTQEQLAWI